MHDLWNVVYKCETKGTPSITRKNELITPQPYINPIPWNLAMFIVQSSTGIRDPNLAISLAADVFVPVISKHSAAVTAGKKYFRLIYNFKGNVQDFLLDISFNITNIRLQPRLPGANEFKFYSSAFHNTCTSKMPLDNIGLIKPIRAGGHLQGFISMA